MGVLDGVWDGVLEMDFVVLGVAAIVGEGVRVEVGVISDVGV